MSIRTGETAHCSDPSGRAEGAGAGVFHPRTPGAYFWQDDDEKSVSEDEAGLLILVQWLSPAFPVGGFAYSHGLEWAIASGEVKGGAGLGAWIGDVLRFGAGRVDAILLAQALRPGAALEELSDLASALAPSAERLRETAEQGAAFTATVNALTGATRPAMPFPVAVGAAAAGLGLAPTRVAGLWLHSFASNLVSAGVRFMPLGQTEGQRVLAGLHPLILSLAREAVAAPLDAIASAALRGDIASMRHETQDVRIFRT